MTVIPERTNQRIITPALRLLPARMDSLEARVMMLAIGLQESRLVHRYQVIDRARPEVKGPARGLWQFERGGGVRGVLNHPASKRLALDVCAIRGVAPLQTRAWEALEHDDLLAACFARLLLWTDTRPLPALGRGGEAWEYYLRNWRPGKPHARTWNGYYGQALAVIAGGNRACG